MTSARRTWSSVAVAALLVGFAVAALRSGWSPAGWAESLWRSLHSMSAAYIAPALALQTLQLLLSASALYAILHYAYPHGVTRLGVLACSATGSAVNAFVPASLGTVVMVLMLAATIENATVPGVVAATAVEKLFWFVAGVSVNVYGTISVGAAFRDRFGVVLAHPWAATLLSLAVIAAVALGGRLLWRRLETLWQEARQGGGIMAQPRVYVRRVLVLQALAWCCKAGGVAVMLTAFAIPVGLRNVVTVVAGNALANVASVTPGGVGVAQAFSVASLHGSAEAATANAYSVASQLLSTAWTLVLAVVLVAAAFGRSGGRRLVEQAYRTAKARS